MMDLSNSRLPRSKQRLELNRILTIIEEHPEEIFVHGAINAVNAARSSAGIDAGKVVILDSPLRMDTASAGSGRAMGSITGFDHLLRAVEENRAGFDAIALALSERGNRIALAMSRADEPSERWKLVPEATINEFFFHLATQLFGPERWLERFAYSPRSNPDRGYEGQRRNREFDEHSELERVTGNWASARIRRGRLCK